MWEPEKDESAVASTQPETMLSYVALSGVLAAICDSSVMVGVTVNRPTYLRLKKLLSHHFSKNRLQRKIYLFDVLDDQPKTRQDVYDEYHRTVGFENMNLGLTLNEVDSLLRIFVSTPLVEAVPLATNAEYEYDGKKCVRHYSINGYRRTQ